MKIGKGKNHVIIDEQIDETARPFLATYSLGDPEKNQGSYAMMMYQVGEGEILSKPVAVRSVRGRPTEFAIRQFNGKTHLMLWPVPDQDYDAIFEFNPPRRRL